MTKSQLDDNWLDEQVAAHTVNVMSGYHAYKDKPVKLKEYQVEIEKQFKADLKNHEFFHRLNAEIATLVFLRVSLKPKWGSDLDVYIDTETTRLMALQDKIDGVKALGGSDD